jgi:hypothetical protein
MSDRRNELAVAIMASNLITGEMKARSERDELAEILENADVGAVPVRDADGVQLGTASLVGGKPTAKVIDEGAFLGWVKANHPDQVREIVDLAYRNKLMKAAESAGVGVDPSTGELIPGVEVGESKQYARVTPNTEARERIKGLIHKSGLLQLTEAAPIVEVRPEPVVGFAGLDDEEDSPW